MSIAQKKKYFKEKIYRIGLCISVKTDYPDDYVEFLELFKSHPKYPQKIEGIQDISIIRNARTPQYYELNMKKENNIRESISYNECCQKIDKYKYLKEAMRYAVQDQIHQYRFSNEQICVLCKSETNIEIDHYGKMFKHLFEDFIKDRSDIPTDFDETYYNSAMFKKEDKKLNDEWCDYHKTHATLRCLCRTCNAKNK
jgi:hypothetical protein